MCVYVGVCTTLHSHTNNSRIGIRQGKRLKSKVKSFYLFCTSLSLSKQKKKLCRVLNKVFEVMASSLFLSFHSYLLTIINQGTQKARLKVIIIRRWKKNATLRYQAPLNIK